MEQKCQNCSKPATDFLLIKGVKHWFCAAHYLETIKRRREYRQALKELHW